MKIYGFALNVHFLMDRNLVVNGGRFKGVPSQYITHLYYSTGHQHIGCPMEWHHP